ncbi:MAG: hypothetical protein J3Q66DRAFT_383814 [Benniella sp.]|nr:MAG: hypothetical protein J3Q66DRAFT_383814 [Benniella sp.]
MTTSASGTSYSQAFRDVSTSRTELIPTRFNKKTEERFILWKDILTVFKNAERIKCDNEAVVFMIDENSEYLEPRRICYYPGVTLDVIVEAPEQVDRELTNLVGTVSVAAAAPSDIIDHYQEGGYIIMVSSEESTHTWGHDGEEAIALSVTTSSDTAIEYSHSRSSETNVTTSKLQQLSEVYTSTAKTLDMFLDDSLDTRLQALVTETQHSLQQFNQLVCSYDQQISQSSQTVQMSTTMHTEESRHTLSRSISANELMQLQMFQMVHQVLENQQLTLNRIQASIRQTYELLEYSIPRLFIVLPKPRRKRDMIFRPFKKKFKLFFLCESGAHTQHGRHSIPHQIHLAKHEGYDLDHVDEFFEKYGPYALAIMKMLKIGIGVTGIAVPALACFRLTEGIESVEKSIGTVSRNFGSFLDEAIKALGAQTKNHNDLVTKTSTSTPMEFNGLEALEGADLRQLESFLRTHDQNRDLGNLYRTVTTDGHVKWVCIDHYREDYRKEAIRRFKKVVESCNGKLCPALYAAYATLVSRTKAKEFYDAMSKVHGIGLLMIDLMWDVNKEDLQALADAANASGIRRLKIANPAPRHHTLDSFLHNNQCDPLVELMCNGHVESMKIKNFHDFFGRIHGSTSMMMTSQLDRLQISSPFSPHKEPHESALLFILRHCPKLSRLKLSTSRLSHTMQLLTEQASRFLNLKDVKVASREATAMVTFSQGEPQGIKLELSSYGTFQSVQELLQMGHLTYLNVDQPTAETIETHLDDVLLNNPKLKTINIQVHPQHSSDIVNIVLAARKAHISQTADPSTVDTLNVKIEWLSPDAFGTSSVVMELEFTTNSDTPSISTHVNLDALEESELRMHFLELFRTYGWSITVLVSQGRLFTDEVARQLDVGTEERGSQIMTLELSPISLSLVGIKYMDHVIERSKDLSRLKFHLNHLEIENETEKAIHLLNQYHNNIHSLVFSGTSAYKWLTKMARTCASRQYLPKLNDFKIECMDRSGISEEDAQWIAIMVAAPPQQPTPSWSDKLSFRGVGHRLKIREPATSWTQCAVPCMWEPLRHVGLERMRLCHEDWKVVIKALDFSSLDELNFELSNFSLVELEFLADCIPEQANPIRNLNIWAYHTDFSRSLESDIVREQVSVLLKKAQWVHIYPRDSDN